MLLYAHMLFEQDECMYEIYITMIVVITSSSYWHLEVGYLV